MATKKITTDFLKTVRAKSKEAAAWFRDIVRKTRYAIPARAGRREIMTQRNIGEFYTPKIGRMYLFHYNAKYKDILPYWDRYPLVFPFDKAPGGWDEGFYGINLHYLPVKNRIDLMTALIQAAGMGGELDDNYRMKLSYDIIKSFKPAQQCIKRYINKSAHRKSPFYGIGGADWAYAAGLPLQKFVGPQPW